jgi:hypothetical protein
MFDKPHNESGSVKVIGLLHGMITRFIEPHNLRLIAYGAVGGMVLLMVIGH